MDNGTTISFLCARKSDVFRLGLDVRGAALRSRIYFIRVCDALGQ